MKQLPICIVCISLLCWSQAKQEARAQLPAGTWQYHWGDDFAGNSLDSSKWNNGSPDWAMSSAAPTASSASKVHVGDDVLTLEATRTKVGGSNASGDENFTGGMISTYQKQNFNGGYIEARILLPETPGSWPAFWGLFDGWPPEMDIMEYPLGAYSSAEYHTAFHYSTGSGNSAGAGKVNPGSAGDLRGGYHTFGAKWIEDQSVQFYFDGNEVSSFYNAAAVTQMQHMYLMLNYAVGGWPATPSTTDWPVGFTDETKVDWVRVWKQASGKTSNWNYTGRSSSVPWDTADNWTDGVPNLGGVQSTFSTVATPQQNIDWSGRRTLTVINIDGDTRYRFGSPGDRLVLGFGDNGSLKPTINIASSTTTEHEVYATLEIAGGLDITNDSAHPLLLTGDVIGGGGSVQISGLGVVSFDGDNSYTADTTIGPGQSPAIARVSGQNGFGVGGVVIIGEAGNSTTARIELENDSSVSNNIAFRGRNNATAAFVNNSGDNTISGTLNLESGGSTYLIRSDSGRLTLSGAAPQAGGVSLTAGTNLDTRIVTLDGSGDGEVKGAIQNASRTALHVTKTGTGAWTLSGDNSYTGATTVSEGMLIIDGTTGTGVTTVAGGAVLGGRGAVRASLVAQPGSIIRVGGDSPTVQTEFLIDDFSGDLSAYTNTRLLDANGGAGNTYAWQHSGEALSIATTQYNGIEQSALTRTDHSLDVGEEIRADYLASSLDSQDIGLYVGAGTPATNVRADYVNVYMRNDGVIYSRGFNGVSELPLASGGAVDPDSLFVARTGETTFELGYYSNGLRTVIATRTLENTSVGDAIGFYSDVRGIGVRGSLDNLWLFDPDSTLILSDTLSIGGPLTLNEGATLAIDLGENASDSVAVSGAAILDGTLAITLVEDFRPELNDTFTVLTSSNITNNLTLGGPDGSKFSLVASTATEIILTTISGLAGDYNNDGVVDAVDYGVWREHLHEPAGALLNDSTGAPIGQTQFDLWRSNFGATMAAGEASFSSVPTPHGATLLLLGLASIGGTVSRRTRNVRHQRAAIT